MRFGARSWTAVAALVCAWSAASAQPVPQPFPQPGQGRPAPPSRPPQQATATTAPPRAADPTVAAEEPAPSEELLGLPVYPGSRFLRSYDAGMGQRYYLFGSGASFTDLVAYYRTVLKTRGDLVFEMPPVHMFEVGRFREETMAFPPGVTIKDYTPGGQGGWLDPRPGAQPQRYPSIIQIVPVPLDDRRR